MLVLVGLVVDDDWTLPAAATTLRARVRNDLLLRVLRARVWRGLRDRALSDRVSMIGVRALATVEAALASGEAAY